MLAKLPFNWCDEHRPEKHQSVRFCRSTFASARQISPHLSPLPWADCSPRTLCPWRPSYTSEDKGARRRLTDLKGLLRGAWWFTRTPAREPRGRRDNLGACRSECPYGESTGPRPSPSSEVRSRATSIPFTSAPPSIPSVEVVTALTPGSAASKLISSRAFTACLDQEPHEGP